jgi:predicted small integral membrane protein
MTDYRPVTLPGRSMKTWEAWAWDHEVDRLEAETIVPVCAWHPYQAKPYAGSRKKWERVTANRGARRYTHQLLGSETINEDWEGHFPGRRDYFNWRDIY